MFNFILFFLFERHSFSFFLDPNRLSFSSILDILPADAGGINFKEINGKTEKKIKLVLNSVQKCRSRDFQQKNNNFFYELSSFNDVKLTFRRSRVILYYICILLTWQIALVNSGTTF
jgi:hypothetical protein